MTDLVLTLGPNGKVNLQMGRSQIICAVENLPRPDIQLPKCTFQCYFLDIWIFGNRKMDIWISKILSVCPIIGSKCISNHQNLLTNHIIRAKIVQKFRLRRAKNVLVHFLGDFLKSAEKMGIWKIMKK